MSLAHRRILITRAPHQASQLADSLRALGAIPILIPTIEIGPPASFAALDAALASLSSFDVVGFTSANAVEAFHRRAQFLCITPAPKRIAVVGPATARAVETMGLHVDLIPTTSTAESLAEALRPEAFGRQVLLILADGAPTILREGLRAAGAGVTVAAAYRNRIPEASLSAIISLFSGPAQYPDAITFTSGSTASNLMALLEAANLTLPPGITRASIGPITSKTLRDLGLPAQLEAAEPTIPALVTALSTHFRAAQ